MTLDISAISFHKMLQVAKKMEAKEAGATGWIIKPFVPAKLIAAINKVIR